MMSRYFFLFLNALLASVLSFAQTNLDSLESALVNVNGKDSVVILNNLGLNYSYSNLSKAKYYSEEALKVARRMEFGQGEVAALINVGYSHFDHNRIDSSIWYFEKAASKAKEIEYAAGIGNANNALGNTYKEVGENDKAVRYYKEALIIQKKIRNNRGISSALNNIGRALNSLAAYNEATEHLLQALEINLQNGWLRKAALNLLGLAQIKVDQQEESLALKYLIQVEEMGELKSDKYIQTDVYNQFGFVHSQLGNFDQSEKAFQQALKLYESYTKSPATVLHNYADMKRKKGELAEAEKIALKALKRKVTDKYVLSQSYTLNLLADIYLEMGETQKALEVSQKALKIVIDKKAKSRERKTYLDMAEIYQKIGDYKQALNFRMKYEHLQDSLFTVQKASQQRAMLTLFETEKKQQQIEMQQAKIAVQNSRAEQQKNRQYLLIGGILVAMLFAITILMSYFNIKKIKSQIESQNKQLTQLNATKDKFFGIIAHDLRSPLIGLQGVGDQVDYFLKKGKTEKLGQVSKSISDTTKRLNELLDNLLSWALLQNGIIPYHPQKLDMKESVNSIIDLLTPLSELKGIKLINEIEADSFVYADEKAVSTILRNLISNSLKYTEKNGSITISLKDQEGYASILINDTGTGISAEQIPQLFELKNESKEGTMGEKGTGLGLVLCKELVELNHGNIKVESEVGIGSTFTLDLPKAA